MLKLLSLVLICWVYASSAYCNTDVTSHTNIQELSKKRHVSLRSDLCALSKLTYQETYPNSFSDDTLDHLFGKKHIEVLDNEMYLLFYMKNTIAGYAKLIFISKDVIVLDKLYILKEHHGSGYGGRLMSTCLHESLRRKFSVLELMVWTKNTKAIRFYEHHGMVSDGVLYPYDDPGTMFRNEYDYKMSSNIRDVLELKHYVDSGAYDYCDVDKGTNLCVYLLESGAP